MLFICSGFSNLKFLSSKFARHLCQLKVAAVKPPCSNYFPFKKFANSENTNLLFLNVFSMKSETKGKTNVKLKISNG